VAISSELASALRKHQREEQLRRGLTGLPTEGLIFCKEDGSLPSFCYFNTYWV
jgi:hypothetical protein